MLFYFFEIGILNKHMQHVEKSEISSSSRRFRMRVLCFWCFYVYPVEFLEAGVERRGQRDRQPPFPLVSTLRVEIGGSLTPGESDYLP